MPIQILNTSFTDEFGNTLPSYTSNAGDKITLSVTLLSNVRISSLTAPLILDPSNNQITISSGSWLQEGFRVGDTVVFTIYSAGGAVITTWSTLSTYVSDQVLDVNSVPQWYDVTLGQFAVIEVPTKSGRGDLEVFFNHVSNLNGGNEFSLIDGEATRGVITDVSSIALGGSQTATLTGNQSGQYLSEISIERQATTVPNSKQFEILITFINSGIYDVEWFNSSDCLAAFFKFRWSRDTGDLSYLYNFTYSNNANTGWFGQGHNIDTINSVLIQGIDEIDYGNPTSHTLIVDGPLTDIGIGASYVPTNSSYYKNNILSQTQLGMVSYTKDLSILTQVSAQNGSGAGYEITIDAVTVAGSQTSIDITITPNAQFLTFMEGVDEGDRLFYLWVKCGNVNLLAYADQLTYTPPPGDPLILVDEVAYYDHAQNVNDGSGFAFTTEFNTEDDLAFYGAFLLDKNTEYSSFVARIEALNTSTNVDFTLLQATFDFSGVPYSSDGRYLLNEVIAVNTILPLTSLKREATLKLVPALDTPTQYGVAIYFPYILRWEYWLSQLNASVDFWPDQNKNWFQYDNTAPWEVQMELELNEPTLSHLYSKEITILDYDSEPDLKNDISLKIESTGQTVGIVVEGELMRVTATHELLNGNVWNPAEVWGMITVEPFEGAPRWLVSSAVPTDGNVLNPLSPISGTLVTITFPSPEIAKMECFFDSSKINTQNGVKFTSKIKGCNEPGPELLEKTTTEGDQKTTTDGDLKTIA